MSGALNIVRIVGIALAIVAAFVHIPYAAAILVVLGLITGIDTPVERRVGVMVAAIVLVQLNTVLIAIPAIGGYLSSIAGNIGIAFTGVALTGITLAIIDRLTGKMDAPAGQAPTQ